MDTANTADRAEHTEPETEAAQVVVIVNANARMGADDCLSDERLGGGLRARGLRARIQPTDSEENCAEEVARAAREGAEVVVAAGGDGTVRSVIVGLMGLPRPRPALGILACGTMNNIAVSFGIPEDVEAALDLLADCLKRQRFFPMDIGMIGEEPFVEVASVGLAAQLFPIAEEVKSEGLGAGADIVEGVRQIVSAQPQRITLTLDGRRVQTHALQVTLCNTPTHGARIVLSPTARVDDGLLDVVVDNQISGVRMLWDMFTRMDRRQMTRKRRRVYQARRVSISQPTSWALQMDGRGEGEYGPGTDRPTLAATVEPGAVRVCAAERPPLGAEVVGGTGSATTAAQDIAAGLAQGAQGVAQTVTQGAQSVTQGAQSVAQTVTQGAQGVAQTVTQGVAQQVQRRLASPEHAAQRLKALRWVYAPGVALGVVGALAARHWDTLPGDLALLQAIQGRRSPAMDRVMTAVAAPGFPPLSVELLGAGALALWLARLRLESGFLLAAAAGVTVLDTTLKGAIRRKRPEDTVARVMRLIQAPSFPSGHTMNYVSVFGFLGAATMANVRPSPLRTALVTGCLGMIALIGPARVYLGAHWPTDTAAGYLFGGLYLGGLLELYTQAKLRQAERHARAVAEP